MTLRASLAISALSLLSACSASSGSSPTGGTLPPGTDASASSSTSASPGSASSSSGSSSSGGTPSDADASSPADADGGIEIDKSTAARIPASQIPAASLNAAVAANNAFALDLYGQVNADAGATNLVTSPISASLALTMTYAGALGDTATQMAAALHVDADAGTSIFDGQNALSQALASRGPAALQNQQIEQPDASADDYRLQIVNSVWGEQTYPWAAPFLDILATSYGTGVYLEDFANQYEPARQAINAWVSSATEDKINDLLPMGALDEYTRMVLVNAIHLKFPWASPFQVSATQPGPFTRADGTTVMPSFMNQTETLDYVDDGKAQVVAIPLTGGLSVVIALPHAGVDLTTYEAGFAVGAPPLAEPTSGALVQLSVPKVTFTSPSVSLSQALQALGMTDAFDKNAANFTGLCPQTPDGLTLYVSDVLQKATVSMQETGVEAAAATAVIIAGANGVEEPPPTPVPMVVNRPYVLSIIDDATGTILFLGHIVDPTDSGGS